jgi:hypothetical protein
VTYDTERKKRPRAVVPHRLQERAAGRADQVGARRLFARLRQALAEELQAGV